MYSAPDVNNLFENCQNSSFVQFWKGWFRFQSLYHNIFQTFNDTEVWAVERHYGYIYVIGNVINSKRRRIKLVEFRQFCKDAYLHIKTYFKYINIANDVHVILGHVCDAIEANGGYGLGDLSEVSDIYFWLITCSEFTFTENSHSKAIFVFSQNHISLHS